MTRALLFLAVVACAEGTDDTDASTPDGTDPVSGPFIDGATWVPEEFSAMAPTRLVIMGDSISAGAGASTGSLTYPSLLESNDSRWPEGDGHDIDTLFPDLADVVDVSEGGATTSTMRSQQLSRLESQIGFPASGETIVVFTIGGNDMQAGLTPTANVETIRRTALDNMTAIIEFLQDPEHFPDGVRIFSTNVYEPSDAVGQVSSCFFGFSYADKLPALEGFNDDLLDLAKEYNFANVDLRGHFLGHGFYYDNADNGYYDAEDPTLWLDPDCIHPNDRGHHEIRELFWGAMARETIVE